MKLFGTPYWVYIHALLLAGPEQGHRHRAWSQSDCWTRSQEFTRLQGLDQSVGHHFVGGYVFYFDCHSSILFRALVIDDINVLSPWVIDGVAGHFDSRLITYIYPRFFEIWQWCTERLNLRRDELIVRDNSLGFWVLARLCRYFGSLSPEFW